MMVVAIVPGNFVLLIGPNFDKSYLFNEVGGASYSFVLPYFPQINISKYIYFKTEVKEFQNTVVYV
jgi:hypothetical protein